MPEIFFEKPTPILCRFQRGNTRLGVKPRRPWYPGQALEALRDFKCIYLEPGESQMVSFILKPTDFRVIVDEGNRFVELGKFDILIGCNSVDLKKIILTVGQ